MGNKNSSEDNSASGEGINFAYKPVDISNFKQNQVIGKGGFGVVRMVTKRDTKQKYALKYINKKKCIQKGSVKNIFRERFILEKCKHPFIINLQFAFQDDNFMFMVLDLALGGDLRFHLQRVGCLPDQTIKIYTAEISSAIYYLHTNQILHRDLKPENLLLDEYGHINITDFNVAIMLNEKIPSSKSGTTAYMAPEMFIKEPYKYSVDWWGLGCILYECTYNVHPFSWDKRYKVEEAIRERPALFPPPVEIRQDKFKYRENPLRTDFIKGLLRKQVKNRLGLNGFQKDIQKHPWLDDIDWLKVVNRELKPDFVPDPNQQNYDFGAALEELLYEGSPLTKNPVRKRKNNKNKPTLALLWNDETPGQKSSRNKLEEELDYIEEYFESYVKPPTENNHTIAYGKPRKNSHSNSSINSFQNPNAEFSNPDISMDADSASTVLRKPVAYTKREISHSTSYKSTSIEEHTLLNGVDPMPSFFPKSKSSVDLEDLLAELKPIANGSSLRSTAEAFEIPVLPDAIRQLKDDSVTKEDYPRKLSLDPYGRKTPPEMLGRRTPPPRRAQTPPLRRATPPLRRGTPLMDIPVRTHSAASSGGSVRRTPLLEDVAKSGTSPSNSVYSSSEPLTRRGTPEIPTRLADASGQAPAAIINGVVKPRPLDIFNNRLNQLDLNFPLKETASPVDRKSYLLSPDFTHAPSPTYEIESYFD